MVVFVLGVVHRGGGKLAGHAEVDFEMEPGGKGKKHALAVGSGGKEFFALENTKSRSGTVAIDAGLGVRFHRSDGLSVISGPLTAGEFDFGEFGHGGRIGGFGKFEIGIWHGMR